MKYIHYIGIDPGLSGAIALVDYSGIFKEVLDIPTMMKGTGKGVVKKQLNAKELQNIIAWMIAEYGHLHAYVENVNSMPGQGVSSVFSLGDTCGVIRAVLACENIPVDFIAPITWKKYYKLTRDKEEARAKAIKLYPDAAQYLTNVGHHNRAEAILMARYAALGDIK